MPRRGGFRKALVGNGRRFFYWLPCLGQEQTSHCKLGSKKNNKCVARR